ncbi:spore germination protein KA [Paenibacillus phyllosphaerae]|uniref:Spore germination protein KA n=1 Tax=Paenibacillus phyllosphaerae TaxID=274593 RepID=A0A7W5B367_9BACL|nr:spore germination protein [Paenibacillus phyllosphaerae]MBB3113569.1 spore germination protein KA [Paenibacillus phyllosphaerae]
MTEQKKKDAVFTSQLQDNTETLDGILEFSTDLLRREFVIHADSNRHGICYLTDGLVSNTDIQLILKTLLLYGQAINGNWQQSLDSFEQIKQQLMVNCSIRTVTKLDDGINGILSGETLVLLDGYAEGLLITTKAWESRSITEPATDTVVRGPRDGFTENIRTNTSLVRKRIKDPQFRLEAMVVGNKTRTDINIAYMKGTVKDGLVEEVRQRLQKIDIDGVLESGYIEELIEDAPLSVFSTIASTERPDKVASALLEGRVAIFVDNTPFVLLLPTFFWQFFQASDDYYSRYWVGSFFRIVRYIAFLISLMLPSLYVMLVSFHQEMIPSMLAFTIASGREVVPFPVLVEAIMMELAFELMREAGLRMPKPVGQAVSIVGSLIIGQAAVQAGLVSPFMVIVVAVTGIASFAIPNYSASIAIRLLRFPLLIASGMLGLLGFAAVFFMVVIHALSIRSFGESYLAPAAPFRPSDQKDIVLRFPWWSIKRPPSFSKEQRRQGKNTMPKPSGGQSGGPERG